jgi:hypothetical protein
LNATSARRLTLHRRSGVGPRLAIEGCLAAVALTLALAGCASDRLASETTSPAATPSPTTNPQQSPGTRIDTAVVSAALDATAAAGPATFKVEFGLSADGYHQTLTRSDGVIDLATSRGRATIEDFPGLASASKREVILVGNRVFGRPLDQGAPWEPRAGGARAFVGLDVAGSSALEVVRAALPRDGWVVIASAPTDPAGSTRMRPENAGGVVIVIDDAGRLVSVVRSTSDGESGNGGDFHELTLTGFGVPLEVETPR